MKITSSSNRMIKEVRSLEKKKNRLKLGLFIVEGIKMLEEIVDYGYAYEYILYTEGLAQLDEKLYKSLVKLDRSFLVAEDIFKELSDTETPQGVLAVCPSLIRDIGQLDPGEGSRYLFLDRLQDPGNLGTIIRTADAFNIDGIIIREGTVDPYNSKVVRATMGSIFRKKIYYLKSLEELEALKEKGFRLLSTNLESSNDIRQVDFSRSIIVIGNESQGVSEEIKEISDEFIKIRMPGSSESLNAAIAASIIMYQASN